MRRTVTIFVRPAPNTPQSMRINSRGTKEEKWLLDLC